MKFKNLILFVFLILHSKFLISCDCPPLKPLSKEVCEEYNIIFSGRVDSVGMCDGTSTAYFFVQALYKGKAMQKIAINFDCSTSCMMNFEKGEMWVIYGKYYKFGKIEVNFCSRSRKFFKDASQDFYAINNQMSYVDEINFLQSNLGTQQIESENNQAQYQRELIKPSAWSKLWLLLISLAVMAVIWFVSKKYLK